MRRSRLGERVSGVVLRVLEMTARTRTETFRIVLDGRPRDDRDGVGEGELLLGEYRFSGVVGETVLLWDGVVPATSVEDARRFFDGNTLRTVQQEERIIDATTAQPLDDDEFWSIIDVLERRTWEKSINAAARALAERGEDFAIRWAQTAALKALPLADHYDASGFSANYELWIIGTTLAQGRDAYEAVLRDPASWDVPRPSDMSQFTMSLASFALDRLAGPNVFVVVKTDFTPRAEAIRARSDAESAQFARDHGFEPGNQVPRPSYTVSRAVVRIGNEFREWLVLVDESAAAGSREERVVAALEALGGTVIVGPEDNFWGYDDPLANGPVFTIRRRSAARLKRYVAAFVSHPSTDGG